MNFDACGLERAPRWRARTLDGREVSTYAETLAEARARFAEVPGVDTSTAERCPRTDFVRRADVVDERKAPGA